jgi:transglutaminase-like putative cysteine protease
MSKRWRFREGWGVVFLTLGLAMITSLAIAGAGWTAGLNLIPLASLGAFIIGMMIAKSKLPGWLGHLFSLIVGFAWSFWLITRLFADTYSWSYRWAALWWVIYEWFVTLFRGGVSHRNVMFILQMALIAWIITHLSVWFIFRARRVWLAIVPSCVLLLANLIYAPNDLTFYLLIYLALALLLVIRFNLFIQGQIWRRERVHFNADEINFDFLRAGAVFTLVILVLAWAAPGAAVAQETALFETLRGPWRDMQSEWNRLFASLNYRPTSGVDFYSRSLNLGGPRELAQIPILEITAPPNARYWRAVVFDEFTGRSWENNHNTTVPFGADNEALPIMTYQARQVITHTVTILGPSISVLPMAAQPIWVDEPARAGLTYVSAPVRGATGLVDQDSISQQVDTISFARSRVPLEAGDAYWVTSLLTQASERQLRGAGLNYPAWITDRYLQLPGTTPDRVTELAQEIAAPYDNVYDKASAIESFLRSEIAYNEKIEAPPLDRDPVDYILFDLQEAYCDYYATSMAVMLRSLGIPSRVVSGYAQGHHDSDLQAYVVLLQDAHTWVEVFYPNYGWVEFEPTAAQPVIVRPPDSNESDPGQGPAQDPNTGPGPDPLDRQDELMDDELPRDQGGRLDFPFSLSKPSSWIFGSLMLVTLAGITVWMMQSRRLARLSSVGAIYHNMLRLARWAGVHTRSSHTPYEHASALSRQVPEGDRPAQHIAGLYARERYGHKPATDQERVSASEAWQDLRPKLVRQSILRHVVKSIQR